MKKEELIDSLGAFGYPVITRAKANIVEILNELADSDDPRLIEGFPVVIAYNSYKNKKLNLQKALSMHKEHSVKRKKLEKLFCVSSELLKEENLKQPIDLLHLTKSLKKEYTDLLANDKIDLYGDMILSTERLRNTFKRYVTDFVKNKQRSDIERERKRHSFRLNLHLSALFAPRQKEIVLKKYYGEPLTKTEQEYFSRIIKKKLEALSNNELIKLAKKLVKI